MKGRPEEIFQNRFVSAAAIFGSLILLGELTLGNPGFPINLWRFDAIAGWKWSLPVHTVGFLWLYFCNFGLIEEPLIIPALFSTLFFLCCETANRFVFQFFQYGGTMIDAPAAFWMVIGLYFMVCTLTCAYLRKPRRPHPFAPPR